MTGMLVVSTGHADPMDQFAKLSQQQHHLQHTSSATHPKWLCPNIFKYYVLLHDNSEGEEEKWVKSSVVLTQNLILYQKIVGKIVANSHSGDIDTLDWQ